MKTNIAVALLGAALISLPAAAQTPRSADQAPKATQQSAETKAEVKAPPLYEMKPGQWRSSKLEGLAVYNTANEKIGDVTDLIVDRNGRVEAVVIGVGGFLGMGEHRVAVPFQQVQWSDQPVEQKVGSNTGGNTMTTTGSGTSTSPAPSTTTTVDSKTGATITTTTPDRTAASDRAAGSSDNGNAGAVRGATGGGASGQAEREAYRGYPDHAIVAMTKDQLKALPEVRYNR